MKRLNCLKQELNYVFFGFKLIQDALCYTIIGGETLKALFYVELVRLSLLLVADISIGPLTCSLL